MIKYDKKEKIYRNKLKTAINIILSEIKNNIYNKRSNNKKRNKRGVHSVFPKNSKSDSLQKIQYFKITIKL